jgi:glycerol-3-phosphate dehydrogenase (NAD(P)+)
MMGGNVAVLGSGSWGLALSNLLATEVLPVTIWPPTSEERRLLSTSRENPRALPGVRLAENIAIADDLTLGGDPLHVILAVPSHAVRAVVGRLSLPTEPPSNSTVICAAKGIETDTLQRMSEVLAEVLPPAWLSRVVVLSGPSHAEEVARGIPTAIVVASSNVEAAKAAQALLARERFRVYVSEDVIGVELGGALKNIIAIAAGITDGLGYGDNTKGALLTRGMVEIARLGVAMGAREKTFAGLTGIGDLITTCISRHSRNRFVGQELGAGRSLESILEGMTMVAEGVRTARAARALAEKYNVSMPITVQVNKILFEDQPPEQAMLELMLRDPKTEDGVPLSHLKEPKRP